MNLLHYSKISLFAMLMWLGLLALGLLAVLCTGYLAFAMLAHRSGMWISVSLALATLAAAVYYVVVANKVVFSYVVSSVLTVQLNQDVRDRLAARLAAKPGWMQAVGNVADLKAGLLQTIAGDSTLHSILRRLFASLLGKIKLDQFPTNRDPEKLPGLTADWLIFSALQFKQPAYAKYFLSLLLHGLLLGSFMLKPA